VDDLKYIMLLNLLNAQTTLLIEFMNGRQGSTRIALDRFREAHKEALAIVATGKELKK